MDSKVKKILEGADVREVMMGEGVESIPQDDEFVQQVLAVMDKMEAFKAGSETTGTASQLAFKHKEMIMKAKEAADPEATAMEIAKLEKLV